MAFFEVSNPDGTTFRFEFEAQTLRIGRSHENDLVLPDETVSRLHAIVEHEPDGTYLLDLGSASGTLVNGECTTKRIRIKAGDCCTLGNTLLTFDHTPAAAAQLLDAHLTPPAATTSTFRVDSSGGGEPVTSIADAEDPQLLELVLAADEELEIHRPLNELFQNVLRLAEEVVPFQRGAIFTLDEDGRLIPQAVRLRDQEDSVGIVISRSIAAHAIQSKQALLLEDALADERFDDHSITSLGVRSAMCVPLWDNREVVGILYVDSPAGPGLFSARNLQILSHLAHIAGVKLEIKKLVDKAVQARLYQQDVSRAAEIQAQFLPRSVPEIPGYRVHGLNRPSFAVGGDLFNYLRLSGGRIGVVLGDVAGNGLPASLLMCSFQMLLTALMDHKDGPEEIVDRANRFLCERIPVNRFITLFLGVLDPQQHVLTYVNAGQNYPFVQSSDGRAQALEVTGLPLGITADARYGTRAVSMESGSALIAYSDGLTELGNSAGDFGLDRVQAAAVESAAGGPAEMVRHILQTADAFADQETSRDDMTLVILQRSA